MRYPDTEVFLKELGKQIRVLRKEKGFSQRELGLRAELEKSEIQRLERGTNPTFKTMLKIANALDVKMSDFLQFNNMVSEQVIEER